MLILSILHVDLFLIVIILLAVNHITICDVAIDKYMGFWFLVCGSSGALTLAEGRKWIKNKVDSEEEN